MISFIIPVLNREEFIRQCLDHIVREMDSNDEIIVVDNGSTDDTVKVARQYQGVRVLEFPDVTIAALRNRGADIAKGDFLAFIDSDCLVCEGWRDAVESVLSDETVKATGSHYDVPLMAGWCENAWWSNRKRGETKVNWINAGNFAIREEAFKAVSGFNEELITDEDTEIGARLNKMGLCIIDSPLVRAIHLGNPKTLKEFITKEKWHATSILSTISAQKIDRPMVMTFVFMFCCLISLLSVPFVLSYNLNPIVLPAVLSMILAPPLVTALYRVYKFRSYQYFFHLVILYLLFYLVRSVTVIEVLSKGIYRRCKTRMFQRQPV